MRVASEESSPSPEVKTPLAGGVPDGIRLRGLGPVADQRGAGADADAARSADGQSLVAQRRAAPQGSARLDDILEGLLKTLQDTTRALRRSAWIFESRMRDGAGAMELRAQPSRAERGVEEIWGFLHRRIEGGRGTSEPS